MEYATYCPITVREKTAPMAAGPAKANRPSRSAMVAVNHTAFTGVCVYGLTR